VQLVETLYRERWTQLDGLGALVLSPTRELALQIFEELRKVGKYHSLSAGLLIGGKSVKDEQEHIQSSSHPFFLSACNRLEMPCAIQTLEAVLPGGPMKSFLGSR
jgi:superfamily II DNA/RNA helicase